VSLRGAKMMMPAKLSIRAITDLKGPVHMCEEREKERERRGEKKRKRKKRKKKEKERKRQQVKEKKKKKRRRLYWSLKKDI